MADKIPVIIEKLKALETYRDAKDYASEMDKEFPAILKKLSDSDWKVVGELLIACLDHGSDAILQSIAVKIMDKRKLIDWKKRHQMIDEMIDAVIKNGGPDDTDYGRYYYRFIESLLKLLKTNKLMKQKKDKLMEVVRASLAESEPELEIHQAAQNVALEHPWKEESHDVIHEIFRLVADCVYEDPTLCEGTNKYHALWSIVIRNFQEGSNPVYLKIKDTVAELFNFCKDQDWTDENNSEKKTISYSLLKETMEDLLYAHNSNTELLRPCIDAIKELLECGDDDLERDANNIITAVAGNMELAGDQTDSILERYFSGHEPSLIAQFIQMYPQAPEKFQERFDDLIDAMEIGEDYVKTCTLQILSQMAKDNSDVFTPSGILAIVKSLEGETSVYVAFQILQPLAESLPADIIAYDEQIIAAIKRLKGMGTQGIMTLVALSRRSEEKARKYMKVLVDMLPELESIYKTSVLYNMRSIGQTWIKVLAEQRPLLDKLIKDPALKDSASSCIDIIEGRSLGTLAETVTETKQDVDKLEERVDMTEENVENLGIQVDENTAEIKEVKTTVNDQGERLDDLEEVVEETVEKVEELDHKTLSHAPMWARDIAELLNPPGDHDWRLLSTRLGYTNDDIRNWATQANPCLSMFDEWFATNKTREATYGVLKQLQEMDQDQAAMIVENSLKAAEGVVEDEEEDYSEPPAIFISYQWGHQDEVKMLKQHLEMAGYEAWMDIGQMGGGDKLFQKIDQGIRAAKVIISCVTEKYAKSPNCNREVNLAVNLGKPVIPLLMDSVPWPPPGAMGPIFGEYLYIKFFKDDDDGEGTYWPTPVFQELLMQLRYIVVPNMDIITEEYKGWTEPPEEIVVVKPRKKREITQASSSTVEDDGQEEEQHPDVFISYQWGKQPEIKALYKKLTAMGFHCWFDIMQMGGGDSLYDKIDKGIRNCQVVVACVTKKYSYSANCRREVSLADALKKPLIPLLLEQMTWPPEGPMSMVMTQLLYIDFCSAGEDIQKHWDVPQFQEMIDKIHINLPVEVPAIEAASTQSTSEANSQEASKPEPATAVKTSGEKPKDQTANPSHQNNSTPDAKEKPSEVKPDQAHVAPPKSTCCIIQ